jgi:CheY-like chemotaxis protein
MGLVTLIFSSDERAVRILRLLLKDLSIQVQHVVDFEKAQESLWRQKYDGIFADCEDAQGAMLLKSVRKSKHNRRSIAFALSGSAVKMSAAFELGAHFIIHKPFVTEKVKRTLNAAHGLMMREQRTNFRHPLSTHVTLRLGQGSPYNALIRDLSQNGALIESGTILKKGQPVQLNFVLPDTSASIEAHGRITWSDATGRAGVHFEALPDQMEHDLIQWVIERSVDPEKPQPKAATAPPEVIEEEEEPELDIEVEVIEPEEVDKRLRQTLRVEHHAPIKALGFEDGRPVVVSGTCSNLSELGVAAELEEDLPFGSPVLVQLKLPNAGEPVVMHAIARHQDENHYGFEFVGLSDSVRELLRASISDLPVEQG